MRSRVPRRLLDHRPRPRPADGAAGRCPTGDQRRRRAWSSPTRRSPGPGRGCRAGSTTTSRASGSCTTSRSPPTPGTPWGGRTTELYRGVRLARALAWRDQHHASLNPVEIDFLAASREAEQVAERSAAEHARRQAVLIRRLRLVLVGAVVLLGLVLGAGGYAVVQSDRAARNAAEARQTAVSADARRVGARSQLTDDISLSLLLAAAGARLDDSPETRVNLLAALAKQPHLVRSAPPGGGYLEVMDVSPDGRWIASSDDQNRMHLYDAATNRLLRSYDAGRPPGDEPASMFGAFSPDSSQLAVMPWSVESTEPVRLLDPDTMEPSATRLASPAAEPVSGVDVEFSADGRYLAATMLTLPLVKDDPDLTPGYAVVWDLRSPSTPPIRVPTGTALAGAGAQPGRPDPVHRLAADGVRRRVGRHDLARARAVCRPPRGERRRGPCSHSWTKRRQ